MMLCRKLLQSEKFLNWRKPKRRRLANIDARHAVQDTVTESPDRPIRPRNPTLVGEKHFTPQELAGAWGVSAETIRQIFREEQGVLKIGKSGTRTKRGYFTLRIPKEVAERVHRRLSA
jgi:hypothetical protein